MARKRVFDDQELARSYMERHRKMAAKLGRRYAEKLSRRGFRKGRLIDVGCGFGGMALVIAERFPHCEVVGIDLSRPLIEEAKRAAEAAGWEERVTFELEDAENIPYRDDSFDVAFNINMVHLVEAPVRMLDETERVLKPGGLLFIADLKRSWLGVVEREIRAALILSEAKELLSRSRLRQGSYSTDLLWWRYEA